MNISISGPSGRIQGCYTKSENPKAPIALVLHPDPSFGGNMDNTVVYHTYKTLAANDFTVLRINFRGVGLSQGEFDNGHGEMVDAGTAVDWLQKQNPMCSKNLIAGFSFGAWIAMQLIMRRPEINNFIAISPPINLYDFSFLSPCPIPGLVVQGDIDSIVPEQSVFELTTKLSKQKQKIDYKVIQGADHFFRSKLVEFSDVINEYLHSEFSSSLLNSDYITENTISNKSSQKVFLH